MVGDLVAHGIEPAFQAAIEGVVVAALVMRLVCLSAYACCTGGEHGMPPAAVAAAIGHVGVHAEIVPARSKGVPIQEACVLQKALHQRRGA